MVSLTGETLRNAGPGEYLLTSARLVDRSSGDVVATTSSFGVTLKGAEVQPGPLELTEAWVLFASIGAGVGLGQFAYTRSHERDSEGQT